MPVSCLWMVKSQPPGMQEQSFCPSLVAGLHGRPVERVSQDRPSQMCQMDPELVSAAGDGLEFQWCDILLSPQNPPLRLGGFPVVHYPPMGPAIWVPPDWRSDQALGRLKAPLNQGQVP